MRTDESAIADAIDRGHDLRIVHWTQAIYENMATSCWTIVDREGNAIAGTFWSEQDARDTLDFYLDAAAAR